MSSTLPPQPEFGAILPSPRRAPSVLDFMALRRSASAPTLGAPAPSRDDLADLLRLGTRVPDHGKLSPWRFIVLEGEAKAVFGARLEQLAEQGPEPEKARGALIKFKTPPMALVVVSKFIEGKIPEWEQRLSAGAVCMTLVTAAQALGYGANWITDWYSYDARVAALLRLEPGDHVAGFVYLGTPAEPPQERVRPDVGALTAWWTPS